ncbi:hypothetical protein L915_02192 [Phytophthora nicotianae]|uniref:Uncharacterized protein n=1 Tax=Phytophthora nicotianae TaxID=4792 RepID=W2HHT4_PHYNI|nr:hypothetical protein L915_02192 [Phytophthora nicotianae]
MDDYSRAAKQARDCSQSSNDADFAIQNATDYDELVGTHEDVYDALDRGGASEVAGLVGTGSDTFCNLFDANIQNDDERVESSLPVFPNSGSSVFNEKYEDLLSVAAQTTVDTVVDLHCSQLALKFSITELQQYVKGTSNDEFQPQRLDSFHSECPTQVIELITNTLQGVHERLSPSEPLTESPTLPLMQSPPAVAPYAAIEEVARAFTLNQR